MNTAIPVSMSGNMANITANEYTKAIICHARLAWRGIKILSIVRISMMIDKMKKAE
jgi:hypothetical protein